MERTYERKGTKRDSVTNMQAYASSPQMGTSPRLLAFCVAYRQRQGQYGILQDDDDDDQLTFV